MSELGGNPEIPEQAHGQNESLTSRTLFDYMVAFELARPKSEASKEGKVIEFVTGDLHLPISKLQVGDVVVIEVVGEPLPDGTDDESQLAYSYIFKVDRKEWTNLGFGIRRPDAYIFGRIDGAHVPNEIMNVEYRLAGSHLSGNMLSGDIQSGGGLCIESPKKSKDEFAQYTNMPITNDYGIARVMNGKVNIVPIEDLNSGLESVKDVHDTRLNMLCEIVRSFGLSAEDFMDCSKSVYVDQVADRGGFKIKFSRSMASGNSLIVYDKKIERAMYFSYFNYGKEDILKVSYVDLTRTPTYDEGIVGMSIGLVDSEWQVDEENIDRMKKVRQMDNTLRYEDVGTVYSLGFATTTFCTSFVSGINSVVYQPSVDDSKGVLGIKETPDGYVGRPNIVISSNGSLTIQAEEFPFTVIKEQDPGLQTRLEQSIKAEPNESGGWYFDLLNKRVVVQSPEDLMGDILRKIKK